MVCTHDKVTSANGRQHHSRPARFLPTNHLWLRNSVLFDWKVESGVAPRPLTGDEALIQLQNLANVSFGKGQKRKSNVSTNAYY